jgi:ribonuclease J
MVTLTFYGGVGEIGGNKFLLQDGDTRIFLDFGQSFRFGEEFFTGYLRARDRFGLRDLFALNLLPKIPGLYSEGALAPTDFPYHEPEFDGVFLTHIHYDHLAHIRFLDEKIPVFLGETTRRMLDSWETTSPNSFGDREYQTFRTGDKIQIGDLEVEPIHVDHSAPAAYGYIVHTSEGAVVYTGDFRHHGPKAELTRDFVERAVEEKPIALICEGTRVSPVEKRKHFTEEGVWRLADRIIKGTDKLVLTCFYGRDVDRMKTYYDLAQNNGRKFVVSTKTAHLLHTLAGDPGIEVPDPLEDDHLLVYRREMRRYNPWERDFLDDAVDARYVHDRQGQLILHLDFTQFAELIDIDPDPGAEFIHSMSEPFEEDDIEDEIKDRWIEYFGMKRHQAHASGHCSKGEVFRILGEIGPKTVFPVHTEHPELFRGTVPGRIVLPSFGEEIEI